MFTNGQKVVCVNDKFEGWVIMLYDQLPIKGNTYTIRSTTMGRIDPKDQGIDSMEASVTLEEIKNPNDPHYKGGVQELVFKADRFRPLVKTKQKEKLYATN